eukprot:jgi/Psemu1/16299/gm1.16299_g
MDPSRHAGGNQGETPGRGDCRAESTPQQEPRELPERLSGGRDKKLLFIQNGAIGTTKHQTFPPSIMLAF